MAGYAGDAGGASPKEITTRADKRTESVGISYKGSVTLTDSLMTGIGGKSLSNDLASSAGIGYFHPPERDKAPEQIVNVLFNTKDSTIIGEGGFAWSENNPELIDNLCSRSVGFAFYAETNQYWDKIAFDMTFENSTASFIGDSESLYSNGIFLSKIVYYEAIERNVGTITLHNSDLYASGRTHAIDLTMKMTGDVWTTDKIYVTNPKYSLANESQLVPEYKTVETKDLVGKNVVRIALGFNYYVNFVSDTPGSEDFDSKKVQSTEYTLPTCTFDAPAGCSFAGWSIDGVMYQPGDKITLSAKPTTVYAVWESAAPAPTLDVTAPGDGEKVTGGKITIAGSTNGSAVSITVNGKTIEGVTLADGKFSASVDLIKGNNSIVVKAINPLGGETQKSINVTYDAGNGTSGSNNNDVWIWTTAILAIALIAGAIGVFYYIRKT